MCRMRHIRGTDNFTYYFIAIACVLRNVKIHKEQRRNTRSPDNQSTYELNLDAVTFCHGKILTEHRKKSIRRSAVCRVCGLWILKLETQLGPPSGLSVHRKLYNMQSV